MSHSINKTKDHRNSIGSEATRRPDHTPLSLDIRLDDPPAQPDLASTDGLTPLDWDQIPPEETPADARTEKRKSRFIDTFTTSAQQKATARLAGFWKLKRKRLNIAGIRPRTHPLLVGPSGAGKSHSVKRFAADQGLPLMHLSAMSWVLHASSSEPHTITRIRDFARANPCGILFIDEIDKANRSDVRKSSWDMGIFAEILTIIDGDRRLLELDWKYDDIAHFQNSFFIVGGGAWQGLTDENQARPMGFGVSGAQEECGEDPESATAYSRRVAESDLIPQEILRRFNARLIQVGLPGAADFRRGIRLIAASLDYPELKENDLEQRVQAAVESRLGVRYLECLIEDFIKELPYDGTENEEAEQEEADADLEASSIQPEARAYLSVNRFRIASQMKNIIVMLGSLQLRMDPALTRLTCYDRVLSDGANDPTPLCDALRTIQFGCELFRRRTHQAAEDIIGSHIGGSEDLERWKTYAYDFQRELDRFLQHQHHDPQPFLNDVADLAIGLSTSIKFFFMQVGRPKTEPEKDPVLAKVSPW